ncbi:MAG TPA: HAD family hydrolase [Pyrinomonadaceae bacterium]|jgi:D-glycero-D-manno-heptose 1,7-bisphosphate phosphatase|nr:HAD family hydrolase [Pyrinomonadaceae bacterium]
MKRAAVFIDRDGTISEEVGYVNHPSRYRVFQYAAEAVALLNRAGMLAVLVTNQAGVARGYFAEELIERVHNLLAQELERGGARLDAIYYCPHHPSVGDAPYRLDCDCRKPKPGLILRAAGDLDVDLARSWMIGDRHGDILLARNAGVRSAFVLSGYGRGEWEYQSGAWEHQPDIVAENLLEAVRQIIRQTVETRDKGSSPEDKKAPVD